MATSKKTAGKKAAVKKPASKKAAVKSTANEDGTGTIGSTDGQSIACAKDESNQ